MVMLVHIAPAKLAARIRRSGLKPGEPLIGGRRGDYVFAFPVLESHTLTHQWTREVLKWRRQPLIGVYFRVPDKEPLFYGHYRSGLVSATAAEAMRAVRAAPDPRGFELLLKRRIRADEIQRIAPIRGVVGWRHFPDAHQRAPCGCPACMLRGEPGRRKLRIAYEKSFEDEA
jgi:hypothetical protein